VETWEIIILVVVAVIVLLAVGGAVARRRQLERSQGRFDAHLSQVNRDLAAAHAEDRGWERAGLEAAARSAYAGERDGAEPAELELLQIIDRPGKDDDKAVFQVGREQLTLGRSGDEWVFESLA